MEGLRDIPSKSLPVGTKLQRWEEIENPAMATPLGSIITELEGT